MNKIPFCTKLKLIGKSVLIFLLIFFVFSIIATTESQLFSSPAAYDAYEPDLNAEWGGIRPETTGDFYCDSFFTSIYKCEFKEFASQYFIIWFFLFALAIYFPFYSIPILFIPISLIYLYVRHRYNRLHQKVL